MNLKKFSELPVVEELQENDTILVNQNGEAKQCPASSLAGVVGIETLPATSYSRGDDEIFVNLTGFEGGDDSIKRMRDILQNNVVFLQVSDQSGAYDGVPRQDIVLVTSYSASDDRIELSTTAGVVSRTKYTAIIRDSSEQ